jgi:hypothetical protein
MAALRWGRLGPAIRRYSRPANATAIVSALSCDFLLRGNIPDLAKIDRQSYGYVKSGGMAVWFGWQPLRITGQGAIR